MNRRLATAEIIAVGSELLTPTRVDTNSLFLTGALNELGLSVRVKHVVGDSREDLRLVVRAALERVDVVITTGGLGPTDDDLTRDVVAEVLGRSLAEEPEIVETIASRFAARGVQMPAVNRRQAMVIEGAEWLANPNGTAPGQWVPVGGRVVVLLPGPPRELKPMFADAVAPRLAGRTGNRRLRRRVLKTTGRSESQIEELTQPLYSTFLDQVPAIETTILASPGLVELHLSCSGEDVVVLDAALENAIQRLVHAVGDAVFSVDGSTLEQVVGQLLRARGWRVSAAESCTGGLVMQRLTDVPGSSAWVHGGVVAYANAVKVDTLGVDEAALAREGAVSEVVAREMAMGVRARFGVDVGVAITGIAGPDGATPGKPVGTVFVAVAADDCEVRRFAFPGDRGMVRTFAATAALEMVRRRLTR